MLCCLTTDGKPCGREFGQHLLPRSGLCFKSYVPNATFQTSIIPACRGVVWRLKSHRLWSDLCRFGPPTSTGRMTVYQSPASGHRPSCVKACAPRHHRFLLWQWESCCQSSDGQCMFKKAAKKKDGRTTTTGLLRNALETLGGERKAVDYTVDPFYLRWLALHSIAQTGEKKMEGT